MILEKTYQKIFPLIREEVIYTLSADNAEYRPINFVAAPKTMPVEPSIHQDFNYENR